MSKLSKNKRKQVRPAAVAKESTRVSNPNVPTKPRKKLITKKQAAAKKAKLKKYAKSLNAPKPKIKGGAVGGGMIGGGKILKGGKMILKYVSKHLAKKGGAKALDKKIKK